MEGSKTSDTTTTLQNINTHFIETHHVRCTEGRRNDRGLDRRYSFRSGSAAVAVAAVALVGADGRWTVI